MSDQYFYRCEKCNHIVVTDEDGCECTMRGISYLYHCPNCGTMAKLWLNICDGSKEWSLPMGVERHTCMERNVSGKLLVFRDMEDLDEGLCPVCGSSKIQKWNPIDNYCPKCGGKMYQDESFGVNHTD